MAGADLAAVIAEWFLFCMVENTQMDKHPRGTHKYTQGIVTVKMESAQVFVGSDEAEKK